MQLGRKTVAVVTVSRRSLGVVALAALSQHRLGPGLRCRTRPVPILELRALTLSPAALDN